MYNFMVDFRVAVKSFIVDENNNLLVLKREPKDVHLPGIWEIPGGRLSHGENPFDGLKREVKEETGLDIEITNPLSVRHFTRQDGQVINMIVFLCRPLSGNLSLSEEHTDHKWLDLSEEEFLGEYLGKDEFFRQEVDVFRKHFMR